MVLKFEWDRQYLFVYQDSISITRFMKIVKISLQLPILSAILIFFSFIYSRCCICVDLSVVYTYKSFYTFYILFFGVFALNSTTKYWISEQKKCPILYNWNWIPKQDEKRKSYNARIYYLHLFIICLHTHIWMAQ